MTELPSKTVRIRKELLEIIEASLGSSPELDRRFGDAVNHVLKRGIEVMGLPKKKPIPLKEERRNGPRHKKVS